MPLADMIPELESGSPDAEPDPDPDRSTIKGGTIGRTATHITESKHA